jgi:hypothetical protein
MATYSELMGTLFIELAFASMTAYDPLQISNYMEAGPQGIDYRYYFSKFLNDQVLNSLYQTILMLPPVAISTRQQTYNTFISPHSLVRMFWNENVATADDLRVQRFMELLKHLYDTSDLRMWGAPGIYNIGPGPGIFVYQPVTSDEYLPDD